jgi:hypothetical protein
MNLSKNTAHGASPPKARQGVATVKTMYSYWQQVKCRHHLNFVITAACLVTVPTTWAADKALLVGVSSYPALPKHLQLAGPANDVRLMRHMLVQSGLPEANIRVLASGAPRAADAPTRAAILAALADLAATATAGDWVVVYLSGHGSQQPQGVPLNGYIEPDGLDEIFLPQDVGTWDGKAGRVAGAIIDDEIGLALNAIRAQGAHVWAIFDTCHSGDMAKGVGDLERKPVTRHVAPQALGVPQAATQPKKPSLAQMAAKRAAHMQATVPASPPASTANSQQRTTGQLVTFYASHADEPAAEERLPDLLAPAKNGAVTERRYYGVFTYLLAQAMPTSTLGFAHLAEQVRQQYQSRPYPRPIFEGNLKQAAPFFKAP